MTELQAKGWRRIKGIALQSDDCFDYNLCFSYLSGNRWN